MHSNKQLAIFIAILALLLAAGIAGFFVIIQDDLRVVALTLVVFTVTITALNIFRHSGWFAALLSILIFGLAEQSLYGSTDAIVQPLVYFSVLTLLIAALTSRMMKEWDNTHFKLDNTGRLIEELRVYDASTGLIRYYHALQLLRTEINRSQRYKRNVCLLLLKADIDEDTAQQPMVEGAEGYHRQIANELKRAVRNSDIPFVGEYYGAVLPETNLEGARIVVDRLTNAIANMVRIPVCIGVAQFPEDGLTEDDLARAAQAALQYSLTTKKPHIQFGQIQEKKSKPESAPKENKEEDNGQSKEKAAVKLKRKTNTSTAAPKEKLASRLKKRSS